MELLAGGSALGLGAGVRNHTLARKSVSKTASLLIKPGDIARFYDAAVSVEWPGVWAPH